MAQNPNVLREKSLTFAKRCVALARILKERGCEYPLRQQLLRSGTSIGANIAEAQYASSRKEFSAKLYISLRECAETLYWLELLQTCEMLSQAEYGSLRADCEELRLLLSSATKTLRDTPVIPNS